MLAHTFLAAMAVQAREKRGDTADTPDLVDLTPAEIRRLLAVEPQRCPARRDHALRWSHWRRLHQARARRCHYMRRGHTFAGRSDKTAPPSIPPRYNPHTQAADQH